MAPSPELIRTLAVAALSPAALALLRILARDPRTISSAARAVSREIPCARSTAWLAVRQLRFLSLIENGAASPARLTPEGEALAEALEAV